MQINYRNADNSPINIHFPDNFEDWVNQETCEQLYITAGRK